MRREPCGAEPGEPRRHVHAGALPLGSGPTSARAVGRPPTRSGEAPHALGMWRRAVGRPPTRLSQGTTLSHVLGFGAHCDVDLVPSFTMAPCWAMPRERARACRVRAHVAPPAPPERAVHVRGALATSRPAAARAGSLREASAERLWSSVLVVWQRLPKGAMALPALRRRPTEATAVPALRALCSERAVHVRDALELLLPPLVII